MTGLFHLPRCIFDFHQAHRHVPHLKKNTSNIHQTTDTGIHSWARSIIHPTIRRSAFTHRSFAGPCRKPHNLDYLYSRKSECSRTKFTKHPSNTSRTTTIADPAIDRFNHVHLTIQRSKHSSAKELAGNFAA